MKKTHILDALQVTAALLITSCMVAYAAPVQQPVTAPKPVNTAKVEQAKPVTKPVAAVVAAPVPEKVVTWQDNPNHCTDAQYIGQDAPFACIDKPVATAPVQSAPVAAVAVVAGCGDNQWAQYIYQHESGCNLNAVNAGGCRGIGQACPGSKLPCGADYACQNAYFTDYANSRYGGWQQAYNFWTQNHWW